jgi:hypothetical protein
VARARLLAYDHVYGVGRRAGANLFFVYLSIIIAVTVRKWPQPLVQIGFRILGSWLGAISLLLLVLSARR